MSRGLFLFWGGNFTFSSIRNKSTLRHFFKLLSSLIVPVHNRAKREYQWKAPSHSLPTPFLLSILYSVWGPRVSNWNRGRRLSLVRDTVYIQSMPKKIKSIDTLKLSRLYLSDDRWWNKTRGCHMSNQIITALFQQPSWSKNIGPAGWGGRRES